MLVAMVTAPGRPASATICASRSCCLALSTWCSIFAFFSMVGDHLRDLDRGGTDQHRLAALHAVADVFDDRLVLFSLGEVDQIGLIVAHHRLVGRDDHDLEAVDLLEFEGLGIGRAGHAGQLVVQAEIVLEGDRGQRLVFLLDRHPFLGLDRLVQALRPAPAGHGAAGELVDDDDLAVAHDVVHVALEQRMRAQRRHHVMHQHDVGRVVQALALGQQAGLASSMSSTFSWPCSLRNTWRAFSSTE